MVVLVRAVHCCILVVCCVGGFGGLWFCVLFKFRLDERLIVLVFYCFYMCFVLIV